MSALPLRSIQPRMPARLRTMNRTRNALAAMIAKSTIMTLRHRRSHFDPLIADRVEIQFSVRRYLSRQRCKNLSGIRITVLFAREIQKLHENFAVLPGARWRDHCGVKLLHATLAIGVGAFFFAEVGRRQDHMR